MKCDDKRNVIFAYNSSRKIGLMRFHFKGYADFSRTALMMGFIRIPLLQTVVNAGTKHYKCM